MNRRWMAAAAALVNRVDPFGLDPDGRPDREHVDESGQHVDAAPARLTASPTCKATGPTAPTRRSSPADLKDKEFFTPAEAEAYAKRRHDQLLAQPRDSIHYDDAIWQTEPSGAKAWGACARRSSWNRETAEFRR